MRFTPKQLCLLQHLRRHGYGLTAHFRDEFLYRELLKKDTDSSVTRSVIRSVEKLELIRRYVPKMIGENGAPAPVFVLTIKGSAALAQEMNDCTRIITTERNFQDYLSLNHHCALTRFHMTTDRAFEGQDYVQQGPLYYEHDVLRPDAEDPSKKFMLYQVISENPRIVCCPDSAIEITFAGWSRALIFEYETGADGSPARIIAKKHKGHFGMASKKLYNRFFPKAKDMKVVTVCPYESFLHGLRSELKGKPGAEHWIFCLAKSVTPNTFLHGEIFYNAEKGPFPLVPPPVPGPLTAGER